MQGQDVRVGVQALLALAAAAEAALHERLDYGSSDSGVRGWELTSWGRGPATGERGRRAFMLPAFSESRGPSRLLRPGQPPRSSHLTEPIPPLPMRSPRGSPGAPVPLIVSPITRHGYAMMMDEIRSSRRGSEPPIDRTDPRTVCDQAFVPSATQ